MNTNESPCFSQVSKMLQTAQVIFPDPRTNRKEARQLLSSECKKRIDGIRSKVDAAEFIAMYGVMYIFRASFGSRKILSSTSRKLTSSQINALTVGLEIQLDSLLNLGSTYEQGEEVKDTRDESRSSVCHVGDEENPALIDVVLQSIHWLAIKDSPAEDFLRQALLEHWENVEAKWMCPRLYYGEYHVSFHSVMRMSNANEECKEALKVKTSWLNMKLLTTIQLEKFKRARVKKNQRWKFIFSDDSQTAMLQSIRYETKVLSIDFKSDIDAPVFLSDYDSNNKYQKWLLIPVKGQQDVYMVQNKGCQLYLGLNPDEEVALAGKDDLDTKNIQWKIVKLE